MKMYMKPAIEIEMVEIETFLAQSDPESIGFNPGGTGGQDDDGAAHEVKEILW